MSKPNINRAELSRRGLDWLFDRTFLGWLSREEQQLVLSRMRWRSFKAGDLLTRQGRAGEGVELIVSGRVVIKVSDEGGIPRRIAYSGPGKLLGEVSIIKRDLAIADAEATTDVETLFLGRGDFLALRAQNPRFRHYTDKLVELRSRWRSLLEIVSRDRLLQSLSRDDQKRLLSTAELFIHEKGHVLIGQGGHGEDVFVVVEGELDIKRQLSTGQPRERVGGALPGDLLGERAVFMEEPRAADVVVVSPTAEVLRISGRAFMEIIDRNPVAHRQLALSVADMGVRASDGQRKTANRLVTYVYGVTPSIGATTLAYGIAGALPQDLAVRMVDLNGDSSAQRLGAAVREGEEGGIPVRRMEVPTGWGMEVVWPRRRQDAASLVELMRSEASAFPDSFLMIVGRRREGATEDLLAVADAAVCVRSARDDAPYFSTRRQLRIQAVRPAAGVAPSLDASHGCARLPHDVSSANALWGRRRLSAVASSGSALGRTAQRLVRLLRGRSVGLALGGGGAFGFAHVGLIQVLEDGGLPIDFVSGTSSGALIGATYVGGGMDALRELLGRGFGLKWRCVSSVLLPNQFVGMVDELTGGKEMSATDIPFFPVGLDLTSGEEFVATEGTLGRGVQSASCIPGVYLPLQLGDVRLVDGGLVNNVPVSTVWKSGADFVIGSNIVPPRVFGERTPFGNSRFSRVPLLGMVARVDDTLRALYGLMSQIGRDRTSQADFLFAPDLEGYGIYDFDKGRAIAAEGRRQAAEQLDQIRNAYQNERSIRF